MSNEKNYQIHVILSDKESIENITSSQLKFANTLKIYDGDVIDYDKLNDFDLILIDENLTEEIEKLKSLNYHIFDKSKIAKISENDIKSLEDFLNTLIYDPKYCIPVYPNNVLFKTFGKLEDKIFECMKDVKKLKTHPNYNDVIGHFDGIKFIAEARF